MQCATGGKFIEFNTIDELIQKLKTAAYDGLSIRIVDQDIGG